MMRILIIENDLDFLSQLHDRLTRKGYHAITVVHNKQAALDMMRYSYDVILLDLDLPLTFEDEARGEKDRNAGLDILATMKSTQVSKTIIMSLFIDALVMEKAAGLNCTYFIFKWLKDINEKVFYEVVFRTIEKVGQAGLIQRRYQLFVTSVTVGVIGFGIILAWFGKSSEAGLLVSATGVVLNLIFTVFTPKRFYK